MLVSLNPIRIRERTQPSPPELVGKWESANNGVIDLREVYTTKTGPSYLFQRQKTWDETHKGPPYREDGVFQSFRITYPWYQTGGTVSKRFPRGPNPKSYFKYDGGFNLESFSFAGSGFTDADFNIGSTTTLLNEAYASGETYGPEAWNRSRPRVEQAGAAVFVGESREIPGMFRGSAKFFHDAWKNVGGKVDAPVMGPKRAADEFLNQQFGWRPFLGDLGKFYDVLQNTDRYLSQIERDNGQWVHRRRVLFSNRSPMKHYLRTYAPSTAPYLRLANHLAPRTVDGKVARGLTDYHHQSFDTVWFSARFKYYLSYFDRSNPMYYGPLAKVRRYMALYGARVNPSVVYNLTPWTWLADWVSNAGDNVDNLTAATFDNLVARNACVMRRKAEVFTIKMKIFFQEGDIEIPFSLVVESKARNRASPFGFDLTWGDFSARQLAILGALGISRFGSR